MIACEQVSTYRIGDWFLADHDWPDFVQVHSKPLLYGGSRRDSIEPRVQMRIRSLIRIAKAKHLEPWKAGNVSDGVRIENEAAAFKVLIQQPT